MSSLIQTLDKLSKPVERSVSFGKIFECSRDGANAVVSNPDQLTSTMNPRLNPELQYKMLPGQLSTNFPQYR